MNWPAWLLLAFGLGAIITLLVVNVVLMLILVARPESGSRSALPGRVEVIVHQEPASRAPPRPPPRPVVPTTHATPSWGNDRPTYRQVW